MPMQIAVSPQLIVLNGLMRGVILTIPDGRSALSLAADGIIKLKEPDSRHHKAILESMRQRVLIANVNWADTLRVNNSQLSGAYELCDGDVLEIDSIELRFHGQPEAASRHNTHENHDNHISTGDVHGPVQTGEGKQYNAGRDQLIAGRDVNYRKVRVSNDYSPWDEIFSGKGFGRALMVLGTLIALAGFGMWAYVILSGFNSTSPYADPFKLELVPGVSMAEVGFAAFGTGSVLAAIGGALSKAARKRQEQGIYSS